MKPQHSSLTSGLESVPRRQAKTHKAGGLPSAAGGALMTDRGLVLYLGLLPLFAHQRRKEREKRGVRTAASGRGRDPLLSQESPQSKDGRALRPTSYKGGRAEESVLGRPRKRTADVGTTWSEAEGEAWGPTWCLKGAGACRGSSGPRRGRQGLATAGARGRVTCKGWTPPAPAPSVPESPLVSRREVSKKILAMSPPGRGQQQGRPASPHSGPRPPRSQPSLWGRDPWGSGGRSRGEVKAETKHVGWGLCGPGQDSASQHQSQGPTRPKSQS